MEKSELTDSLNQESIHSRSPRFITSQHDPKIAGKLTTSEMTETNDMEIPSSKALEDHSTLRNTNDDTNHSSESSESDEENKVTSGNKNDNSDRKSDSDSSESDKEHDIDFASRHPLEKEADIVSNDLKQSPLISTKEVVYESAMKNTNGDMDHNGVSKSFESDNEQEVIKINTTIEECPKIDEVVYVSGNRNTVIDSVSESSFESDKERDSDFAIGKFLEKEVDIVNDDLKQSPLMNTVVEECSKTDITAYESAIKNINDDIDNVNESSESNKEHDISIGQSLKKETDLVENDLKLSPLISTIVDPYESDIKNINDDIDVVSESTESDLVTNDLKQSLLISTTIEKCPIDEVVYEYAVMNTNNDMDHRSISRSLVSDKEHVFNFAEPDIEHVNQPSSNDEGHNYSISYDDLQEEFASGFDVIPEFHRSVSMESVESVDGSNVSEIEGESIVDRLKRQVEYDKKCINSLYNELEEERSASEVAVSQAMAMITRLQEEKATMNMDALHYLRMMEEQAEYDVEAIEKANELLNEKDRDIQELEAELEYYRSIYTVDTIVEDEHENSDDSNEEHHEYNGNHSFKSRILKASKESYRSLNNPNLCLEFEDEKHYIQLCLKSLEDKISKIFTNGQQEGEESIEENGSSRHIEQSNCNGTATPEGELVDVDKNGHFGCEESLYEVKDPISCANKLEEVDFLALEHKISELTGRLEALQADHDFLEHSLNSLRYGEEGLQFARNIVNQLQELCKIGIRLDRRPRSKVHAA
ncbi:myosin-binding protein 1-like [Cucurbita pepo subsp. pepo]|uniref:myosin-binding protein 1-like n=1 Tax=Cucurbita pepo subsp. pepo TaxID=3664 RepID=UPI000C9D6D9C|nr:myosin-binding protein 1-like [Cucurbita pepo subsp. pepo]XP_023554319.1 myosin-binding protein 1-like [Cucurbita pepo subsp. pepo]XP_023554320.1 myosin-binding protein 1-like [Cucurbita pepo subsp. pepo]